ncbi:MAG: peptide chain release factor N(5)-glutamine methyltransferase [Verrucomicrobiales bacterium]
MKTVLEVLQSGAAFLGRKGVEQSRLNMEHLLAHVLGLKRLELYLQFDRPLAESELAPLRSLIERRAGGEPLQHVLGTVEFSRHVFRCDRRALVPRLETEELVEKVMARLKRAAQPPRSIMDMGCGSGVIGLSLACGFPEARVTLVDISPEALELARENAQALGILDGRVGIVESDLFERVPKHLRFEAVVANLPYIPASEIPNLSREVRHDPLRALEGGEAGTEIIERFVRAVPEFLEGNGLVALEVGFGQGKTVSVAFEQAGWSSIDLLKDLAGRERFVFARAKG